MGMPALVYQLRFMNHGIAGLLRAILNFAGIRPLRESLYGMVDKAGDGKRHR